MGFYTRQCFLPYHKTEELKSDKFDNNIKKSKSKSKELLPKLAKVFCTTVPTLLVGSLQHQCFPAKARPRSYPAPPQSIAQHIAHSTPSMCYVHTAQHRADGTQTIWPLPPSLKPHILARTNILGRTQIIPRKLVKTI